MTAETAIGPYTTIEEVIKANTALGHHFFDADTLRFFDARIESRVLWGRYFVTSEQDRNEGPLGRAWGGKRRFTVRRAADNGAVSTVGEFGQYGTAKQAFDAIPTPAEKFLTEHISVISVTVPSTLTEES